MYKIRISCEGVESFHVDECTREDYTTRCKVEGKKELERFRNAVNYYHQAGMSKPTAKLVKVK